MSNNNFALILSIASAIALGEFILPLVNIYLSVIESALVGAGIFAAFFMGTKLVSKKGDRQ